MDGRELLKALMDSASPRWNSNSLAVRLGTRSLQPQIHRFLKGELIEPRRSTFQPIAAFFEVPLEAFYSDEIAETVAAERGLFDGALAGAPPAQRSAVDKTSSGKRGPQPSIEEALAMLGKVLESTPPEQRASAAAMLKQFIDHPSANSDVLPLVVRRLSGELPDPLLVASGGSKQ